MLDVYSMSAISTWKRCPKKFQIQYKWLLDGLQESQALTDGTTYHKLFEQAAKGIKWDRSQIDPNIYAVAFDCLLHNPLPANIVSADDPYYIEVAGVMIRYTPDLVYVRDGVYVIRDWKTFTMWPSYDADLDFQAHVYMALLRKHFDGARVEFEHFYVRKTPPNVPKDKKGNEWSVDECYRVDPLIVSDVELDKAYDELCWDIDTMREAGEFEQYSRTALKGGGYTDCSRCSVKEICKQDKVTPPGEVIDLRYISRKREPETMPTEKENI